ncbi:pyrophosphatase PpaX [Clostridium rectalis]|uniref:pyrophosphatase PpaX n=1 Tax=Clostridium rectalis TaxID=2040295 RepID=UPI000F63B46C|nr:pyrophosphatase PpaX [Clostridium rectalis]
MFKAILFDLDGTLINTNNLILQSFRYTLREFSIEGVKDMEIINTFGQPLLEAMELFSEDKAKDLVKTYLEYNRIKHDELTKKIEGVEEGLVLLKEKGIKLAVVTSKRRQVALRGLKLFNLDKYMDIVVCPEDTKRHKPEAEPVLKACEILKILPEDALMVGDSHNDILCGKNAGAKTCLVKYTALCMNELMTYSPDYIIDSLVEINLIIDKEKKNIC